MKARVKATGEFIEVVPSIHSKDSYDGNDGYTYTEESLIMLENEPDYWEKLHHQASIDFMKSFLDKYDGTANIESLLSNAIKLATALVNRLKEE